MGSDAPTLPLRLAALRSLAEIRRFVHSRPGLEEMQEGTRRGNLARWGPAAQSEAPPTWQLWPLP